MPAAEPRAGISPTPVAYSLYTTLLNSSGKETVFSFIPPHGKTMAANEQLTVAGNIVDRLAVKTSNRQFQAMERAVASGALTIVSTPGVFVYNGTKPQVVGGGTGTLGMIDPIFYIPGSNPPELPDVEEEESDEKPPSKR
jgi:hypothetical protein